MLSTSPRQFYREVKRQSSPGKPISDCINGFVGGRGITEHYKRKNDTLYSSVPSDGNTMRAIEERNADGMQSIDPSVLIISMEEVRDAVRKMWGSTRVIWFMQALFTSSSRRISSPQCPCMDTHRMWWSKGQSVPDQRTPTRASNPMQTTGAYVCALIETDKPSTASIRHAVCFQEGNWHNLHADAQVQVQSLFKVGKLQKKKKQKTKQNISPRLFADI